MEDQGQQLTHSQIQQIFQVCEYHPHIEIRELQNEIEAEEYSPIDQHILSIKIHQIQDLFVQSFYFLFTCYSQQIFPQLHSDFFLFSIKKETPIILFSKLYKERDLGFTIQSSCPYFTLYSRILELMISSLRTKSEESEARRQINLMKLQTISKLIEQIKELNFGDKESFEEFERSNFIKLKSSLYKLRNYSICLMIMKDKQLQNKLKEYLRKEREQILCLQQKKILHKKFTQMNPIEINIERNLHFYLETFKSNPLFIKLIENNSVYSADRNEQVAKDVEDFLERKTRFRLKIKGNNEKSQHFRQIETGEIYQPVQCNLQYNPGKHLLLARISLNLNMEGTQVNSLLFKWNTLAFSAGIVSLELNQKVEFQRKKKELIIKIKTQRSSHQSLILKTLKIIDLALSVTFTLQNWIANFNQNTCYDSVLQLQDGYERVKHYARIADRLNERVYGSII